MKKLKIFLISIFVTFINLKGMDENHNSKKGLALILNPTTLQSAAAGLKKVDILNNPTLNTPQEESKLISSEILQQGKDKLKPADPAKLNTAEEKDNNPHRDNSDTSLRDGITKRRPGIEDSTYESEYFGSTYFSSYGQEAPNETIKLGLPILSSNEITYYADKAEKTAENQLPIDESLNFKQDFETEEESKSNTTITTNTAKNPISDYSDTEREAFRRGLALHNKKSNTKDSEVSSANNTIKVPHANQAAFKNSQMLLARKLGAKIQIPNIDEQAKLNRDKLNIVNTPNIPVEPLQVNNTEANNSVQPSNPINDNVTENNTTSANDSKPQNDTHTESNMPNSAPIIESRSSNSIDTNANTPSSTFIRLEPENHKPEIKSNNKKNIALGSGAIVILGSAIAAGVYGIKKQFAYIIKEQIKNNTLDLSLFNCDELLKFKDMLDQETNDIAKEAILDRMTLVICNKVSLTKKTKCSFTHWLSQVKNLLSSKNKNLAAAAA